MNDATKRAERISNLINRIGDRATERRESLGVGRVFYDGADRAFLTTSECGRLHALQLELVSLGPQLQNEARARLAVKKQQRRAKRVADAIEQAGGFLTFEELAQAGFSDDDLTVAADLNFTHNRGNGYSLLGG